jgi:protein-S-isoprenylcysteine O-methyltransferase Ste14
VLSLSPLALNAWTWISWFVCWVAAAFFARATKASEGWLGRMQHIVPLLAGFALIFQDPAHHLIYGRWHHNVTAAYAADALTAAGLLFSVWGRVHLGRYWSGTITLKEGHRLIRTGPYRFVRHPLYTGFITAVLGSALAAGTGDAAVGFVLILIAYVIKMRREEALLTKEFGDEYLRFKQEVRALVPGIV